jgi:hypothetical protein
MKEPRPYYATRAELRAIDEAGSRHKIKERRARSSRPGSCSG